MSREDTTQDRLRALAANQYASISDRSVFDCWHVVVEAIEQRWLTSESLDELIDVLQTGGGVSGEEYGIDVFDQDRVEVALVSDRFTCSRPAMLFEVRRLAAALRGAPHPDPPGTSDITRATALLRALADLATAGPDTEAGRQARAEAASHLSSWAASDPTPPSDYLKQAAETLTPGQRAQLVDGLRAFADWAERPDPTAGQRVDAVIAGLERSIGPLLEHGRGAEQAATDARIAANVQDSIARRLREAGAAPEDPATGEN